MLQQEPWLFKRSFDLLYPVGYNMFTIKITRKKELDIYTTKQPFINWLEEIKDKSLRYRIKERLDRVALGNMGDFNSVGKGVMELRLAFGSGYRIYYAEEDDTILLLLCGDDKSSQSKDIKKAHLFWDDYLKR